MGKTDFVTQAAGLRNLNFEKRNCRTFKRFQLFEMESKGGAGMSAKVSDVIQAMETICPASLAEDWDNVGLQVGHRQWPVKSIWIALDPQLSIIDAAARNHVDLIITHHPLIFHPIHSVDFSSPVGAAIQTAAVRRIAVFTAHTNLDKASGGVNDVLCDRIGLTCRKALEVAGDACMPLDQEVQGLGRIGDLPCPMPLAAFASLIKKNLNLSMVRYSGNPELMVRRAAVCSGSGSGLLNDFLASNAEVYVSGDLRYHDARNIEAAERALIDIGHFGSERLIVEVLAERLNALLAGQGFKVAVNACSLERDPFGVI